MSYKFKTVRLVISQPRVSNSPQEWALPVNDLLTFGVQARTAGVEALVIADLAKRGEEDATRYLCVSEDGCRFCPAKATCPALAAEVASMVSDAQQAVDSVSFDAVDVVTPTAETAPDKLGAAMSKVKMIEDWCTAVRAEVERRLLSGQPVDGYKLVQGRKGARHWTDPETVESLLRKWRVKTEEMYKLSLISPTEAEKRMANWLDDKGFEHEPIVGPRNWAKLTKLVGQSDGKPSVAPASDKRPALVVGAQDDDFEDQSEADDLL